MHTCCRLVELNVSLEGRETSIKLLDDVVTLGLPDALIALPAFYYLESFGSSTPMVRPVHAKGSIRIVLEAACNNACISRHLGLEKLGPDVLRSRYVVEIDPIALNITHEHLVIDGVEAELVSEHGRVYLRADIESNREIFSRCGGEILADKLEQVISTGVRLDYSTLLEIYRDLEAAVRLRMMHQAVEAFTLANDCLREAIMRSLKPVIQPLVVSLYTTLGYAYRIRVADERVEHDILSDEESDEVSTLASTIIDKKVMVYSTGRILVEIDGIVYTMQALPDRFRKVLRLATILVKQPKIAVAVGLEPSQIDVGMLAKVAREKNVKIILTP